jgi:hypothetical protein
VRAPRAPEEDQTSLGVFRPADVEEFTIDPDTASWDSGKQAIADQPSLFFASKKGLEKIPYRFRYRYRCADPQCRGHHQSNIDWELAEAFRKWPYAEQERLNKIRQRFFDQMCRSGRDTLFFVGNQHLRPEKFLVLGVFWPPSKT